jgi:hypothetical protein
MRFAWCITATRDTSSEYIILIAFSQQQFFCANAAQCYVILVRTFLSC